MRRRLLAALLMAVSLAASVDVSAKDEALSDSEIRQLLIKHSIAAYPGRCPCPYNLMSNGRRCGNRSAWSKPGGYAPLCYPQDVADERVKSFRRNKQ